jgi:GTP-binding protein EngB required for normal cell division
MCRGYLKERNILSRCCILVDCTRGLCEQDILMIKFLQKSDVPWMVVLTKADLLSTHGVAQCMAAIESDLKDIINSITSIVKGGNRIGHRIDSLYKHKLIIPVSATTGAGIYY